MAMVSRTVVALTTQAAATTATVAARFMGVTRRTPVFQLFAGFLIDDTIRPLNSNAQGLS